MNISTTGLLVETPSALRPDLKIRIRFEGTFSRRSFRAAWFGAPWLRWP